VQPTTLPTAACSGSPMEPPNKGVALHPTAEMYVSTGPMEAGQVLSKLEGLAVSQHRIEMVLAELRRDLSGIMRPSVSPAEWKKQVSGTCKQAGCQSTGEFNGEGEGTSSTQLQEEVETFQVAPSLPLNWPSSVFVRVGPEIDGPGYSCSGRDLDAIMELEGQNAPGSGSSESRFGLTATASLKDQGMNGPHRCSWRCPMVNPSSNLHVAYCWASIVVLCYDLIATPFIVAWDVQIMGVLETFALFSCLFWTLDIALSFFTGYTTGERLEMRPCRVAKHFLRTWFLPDIIFVAVDWTSLLVRSDDGDTTSNSLRILRFIKLGKLLRLFVVFRMNKLAAVVDKFVERTFSANVHIRVLMRCLLLFVGTLWLNHLMGCAWFAVGRLAPADTGFSWVDVSDIGGDSGMKFLESARAYQYITSIHWSMAQFTLGSIEIGCYNSVERLFNIGCLVLGLLFGSTLVSLLSATMVEYQMMRQDQTRKVRELRHYLQENSVSPGLAFLIQQQATERLRVTKKIQEKDVKALELLSRSLRTELRYEIMHPHISTHPLFHLWTSMDDYMVRGLCMDAIEYTYWRPEDEVFYAGTSTDKAYYLAKGKLVYTQYPESSAVEQKIQTPVSQGRWLSEAALWSHWIHVGTTKAHLPSEVLVVPAEGVMHMLKRNRDVLQITLEYGRQFHRRIVAARPPEASWPNDLEIPCTEYGDLVASMDAEIKAVIGLNAIDHVIKASWHRKMPRRGTLVRLKQEIRNGKSTIMLNAQGKVERVVSVVALRLQDSDGNIFTELGQMEGGLKACCQLPGAKREQSELANETLQRLLAKLRLPSESVEVLCMERHVQYKESREYQLHSRYLRTIHVARLMGEVELPRVVLGRDTAEVEGVSEEFARLTVYVSPKEGGKCAWYAWLCPATFERLSSVAAEPELTAWLTALSDSDMEERSI